MQTGYSINPPPVSEPCQGCNKEVRKRHPAPGGALVCERCLKAINDAAAPGPQPEPQPGPIRDPKTHLPV